MAKDKGKKTATKSGAEDFAKPSDAPAGGDGWSFATDEHDGELFLITPLRSDEHDDTFSKKPGATKEHIVADIVHLNERKPAKSEEHEDAWIFGGWLMGAVRGYINERRVLGRLAKVPDAKSATGYVWKLEDAEADDVEVARAYLASLDPFAAKGKGKAKAEKPAPEKSSKKSKPAPEPVKGKKKSKK